MSEPTGVHPPKDTAAGLTGVRVALRRAVAQMGVKNTAKTLTPGEASVVKARFKASIVAGDAAQA